MPAGDFDLLGEAIAMVRRWEGGFGSRPDPAATHPDAELLRQAWAELASRMAGNHPFFHPRYAGQMLKPPHPVAVAGYLAGLLVNPNNHAFDASPATTGMELEAVAELAAMLGLPEAHLGHLTSGGTVANLEALWVARELRPGTRVVCGDNAHYTHARMCEVLGVVATSVPSDPTGHLDLDAAEAECRRGDVGTVVVTAGTTGLGAVDDIAGALELRERYGVRVHVDAAYGGFFTLLAGPAPLAGTPPRDGPTPQDGPTPLAGPTPQDGPTPLAGPERVGAGEPTGIGAPTGLLDRSVERSFRCIGRADSVVVDPHKHGLQPYGCGAVLFADPSVARFYAHDSPYTYYTRSAEHLGEVSLECSRPGAAAAALWLTLRTFPLRPDTGLGPIVAAGRRAALDLADRLGRSERLRLHVAPELDIVTYFAGAGAAAGAVPDRSERRALDEAITAASERILAAGASGEDPVWLSTLRVEPSSFAGAHPDLPAPERPVTLLRSVLMKPEHEEWVGWLHGRLEALAAAGA